MKKKLVALGLGIILLVMAGMAQASLVTIGTATYGGSNYNLIWDNNNNGNSVIWLDYTNAATNWSAQMAWAAGLDGQLTNIDTPGWTVAWDTNGWRLPSAGMNPQVAYNMTTSEMGHLYYTEFGLQSYADRGNVLVTAAELNLSNFDNLIDWQYWTDTERDFPLQDRAWVFDTARGLLTFNFKHNPVYALALRNGQVSAVPIPGALWLLGSGLFGLVAVRRKKKS